MGSRKYAERIAKRFHETYEELAPHHGYETRRESAVPWDQVPAANHDLMVDVVDALLNEGVIEEGEAARLCDDPDCDDPSHAEDDEQWCPVHGRWAIGNPCEVSEGRERGDA